MMERNSLFSGNNHLGICSEEGILRVWDSTSGEQKTEFTPASHLSATFTCLSWKIPRNTRQKRTTRTKNAKKDEFNDNSIIALGSESGNVYLYDYSIGELAGKLSSEHSGRINSLCWNRDGSVLFSCSNDKQIVEWDIDSFKSLSKWEADKKNAITCISYGPADNTLFSASKSINLWDLNTKCIIAQFNGHSSPIFSIVLINQIDKEKPEGNYILSAACEDRVLNAWQISKKKQYKKPITIFTLPAEPVGFNCIQPSEIGNPTKIIVLTTDGELVLYSHVLNGRLPKPLKPINTIKITDDSNLTIKILAAKFTCDNSESILIAYGTTLNIKFETLNLGEFNNVKNICLKRRNPMDLTVHLSKSFSKLKVPIKNEKEVMTLMPGVTGHQQSIVADESQNSDSKKRRRTKSIGETQLTMEDRLNAISASDKEEGAPSSIKTESVSVLLVQGLQSNDREILNRVLQKSADELIHNTVRRLPVNQIIPLIEELMRRLGGDASRCCNIIKWVRITLLHHTAYLMTLPNMKSTLNHLNDLIDARTSTHSKLLKLEGKLDLVATQIKQLKNIKNKSQNDVPVDPVYVYEEESSDEHEELMDDLPLQQSDSSTSDWEEEMTDDEDEKLKMNGDADEMMNNVE